MIRPTVATVDLAAIRRNLDMMRRLTPDGPVCAVVKADAYGHGITKVGADLSRAGAEWLGVALVEEGIALREAGVATPVLVMATAFHDHPEELVAYDLVPTLFRIEHLARLAEFAGSRRARFHLKIDTGMARFGLHPSDLDPFLDALTHTPHLILDGVMTHFANADIGDAEFTGEQLRRFDACVARIRSRGFEPTWLHTSNSAGVLSFPWARRGMARLGLSLFGLDPRQEREPVGLVPAMRWTTRVVHVKEIPAGASVSYGHRWTAARRSCIATLPVGYADGYPHRLGNRARVLVRGQPAPVVGSVCMDLILADVTGIPSVAVGDEVVLLGRQGQHEVSAYDLAAWADTIPYEIVCGIGPRVPRVYSG
jgi:alanine racemase